MAAVAVTDAAPAECVLCILMQPSGRPCVLDAKKVCYQSATVLMAFCGDIDRQNDGESGSAYCPSPRSWGHANTEKWRILLDPELAGRLFL